MIYQDIKAGRGVGVVDPHGELAEKVLDFIPSHRINDTIYFNPADIDYPIAFNVLEKVDPHYRHLVASGLIGVFKKIWADSWGPRLEYVLRNAILALLEYPGSTLLGIMRILVDKEYRKKVVAKITDPIVKSFWVEEFPRYPDAFKTEAIAPIQNKVGQFLSTSLIRNIVGQVRSAINIREVIDKGMILILNLSKGRIGEDASALLGAMLITKIQLAAMSRIDIPEQERRDFYLYVDEFQNFATESFVNVLSEARKYHLCLTLAHQYIAQLDEKVRAAVFGNVGTIICFRVGPEDAEILAKEFAPRFDETDLINLDKYHVYVKLMIDGVTSEPFSAVTLPPITQSFGNKEKIIRVTRERYAEERRVVEEKIARWAGVSEEEIQKKFSTEGVRKYEAECSVCGAITKVPFIPDGIRPVYCKKCLKEMKKRKKEIKLTQPAVIQNQVSQQVDQKQNQTEQQK
jgi:CxxC-x17-CxxC domain-containing protein